MRRERVKAALTTTPYTYVAIISFIAYLGINFLINDWHIFLPGVFAIHWYVAYPYTIFGLIIAIMIALSISLGVMRVKEVQKMSGASGLSLLGAVLGILTGACPGCLVGLLPAIAGIFGGTLILSDLPLFGIEIQLATIAILAFAIYKLSADNTCKIKKHPRKND